MLGVSKPGEVVAGPVGVNPVVVLPAAAEPPRRLAPSDVRDIVASSLLSVVARIKDLKDYAVADEAVTRDLVAVESALCEILASYDVPETPSVESNMHLSKRESQVLSHVATGLSDKEIARRLAISQRTVHNHLSHVFNKLHVGHRTEAVMSALRRGVL